MPRDLAAACIWGVATGSCVGCRAATGGQRFGLRVALAAMSLGLLAGLVGGDRVLPRRWGSAGRSNLLLVVLDPVRRDRLSSYGYLRRTTPQIDPFATDAIRFSDF